MSGNARTPSWLDFLPPGERYLCDTDPAYREALRGTTLGQWCELRAAWRTLARDVVAPFARLLDRLTRGRPL